MRWGLDKESHILQNTKRKNNNRGDITMNKKKRRKRQYTPPRQQNLPIPAQPPAETKKTSKWTYIERIISVILMFVQIIGIFLTYHTLQEMKEERNSSYRPTLVFDPSYYVVNYSESPGNIDSIKKSIQEEFGHFEDFEDYPISKIYYDNIHESMCYERIPLKCANVGVGPATDIRIWVEEKDIEAVLNEIEEKWYYTSNEIIRYDDPIHIIDEVVFSYKMCNHPETEEEEEEEKEEEHGFGNTQMQKNSFGLISSAMAEEDYDDTYLEEDKEYTIKKDYHMNCIHYSLKENAEEIQYLLASADNTQTFHLPMIYSCLAHALYGEYQACYADGGFDAVYDIDSWNPYLPVIPDLPIKISYYDAENTYHVADYYITTTLMQFGHPNLFFSVSIKPESDRNQK